MTDGIRASSWAVTAFFDTPKTGSRATVESYIERAREMGWGVEGQIEKCPTTGSHHFQLLVRTPQTRISAIKRCFPHCDVSPARNVKALQTYVNKEETRVESMKKVEVTFLTWKMVRDKFFEWLVKELDIEALFTHDTDARLALWDKFIGLSIGEGMEVDTLGVNPQYRSCIIKYWASYVHRQIDRQTAIIPQTDRQTDSQEVSLPVIT